MMTDMRAATVLLFARFDAALLDGSFGLRLALDKGGFPVWIPPLASLDVNNRISCQSPGRGRPH
jgi:hypothetical protein